MAGVFTHFLFDFDGTLADSRQVIAHSLNFALGQKQLPEVDPELVFPLIGKKNLEDTFWHFYPELTAEELEPLLFLFRKYQVEHAEKEITVFPEVPETLAALQSQGAHLAILTTKSQPQIEVIARVLGLDQYFSLLYGSGLPHGEKPEGRCAEYVLSQLPGSSTKSTAVMIGDSEVDAATARNAGISFLGVGHGVDTPAYLRSLGAKDILQPFSRLLEHSFFNA